ncbi:hypothetical protein Q9L58_000588 [Maublancomyces gigas]|uniref:Peroxisomal membrane protein 4 n=1 Tax=Discina gigas TaxID=1032678 RepID=A0ABR3GWR5_9PEZI
MASTMDIILASLNRFILDPKNHDVLAIVKGLRNGLVYGAKVRFPHALVMIFLFRDGTFREKLSAVLTATRTHSKNLALFVTLYKTTMYALSQLNNRKERSADSFIAGLLGGYVVFGRGAQSSVNQQIVIYVFARVALALAKLSVGGGAKGEKGEVVRGPVATRIAGAGWPIFASVSWALVMWLFRWHPESIQPSLRSSMKYL